MSNSTDEFTQNFGDHAAGDFSAHAEDAAAADHPYSLSDFSSSENFRVKENVEYVLATALELFAQNGFTDTKLDTISRATGMSKRMIHYHFGDKKGLYNQCLMRAVKQLRPAEMPHIDIVSVVPVDGVRTVIETLFKNYVEHPSAIRLLILEDLNHWSKLSDTVHLNDYSNITIQLDKLLLRGQDSGAFRPGIATQDILTLITSLVCFRLIGNNTAQDLYGVDLMSPENTKGLEQMAVDMVIAFLTSHLPAGPGMSYVSRGDSVATERESDASYTYEIDVDPFE